jgi:hypothetical protein
MKYKKKEYFLKISTYLLQILHQLRYSINKNKIVFNEFWKNKIFTIMKLPGIANDCLYKRAKQNKRTT